MRLKQFTAILLIVCMMATFMPTAFATTQNFKDFPTGWSKEAMTAAVNNGLLVGVSATEICPTANLTRAELAAIVVRAFGAKTKADITAFTDVPSNAWYYDYIAKAVKMEALKGKSETEMEPLQPITREEVFTALARILVLESDNSSVLSKFNDGGDVSDWAVKSVSALVEKGYVNGDDLGNLNPKANITREEFAQFMHNMIKVYITKPGIYTDDMTGITVLRVGGVTLKGVKQVYDLVAGDGVGFDEVKLEDVEIVGRLLARGGEFTLKRTTVSENVVVKNVNGVVHFNNYRDEAVFSDINEITKATFLSRTTGTSGTSSPSVSDKVSIKFVADGVEVDTVSIKKGSKFTTLPDIPEKTGYTALGWYDGDTKINVGDTVPSSDTTLYAKYEINKYTVTFDLDNGEDDIVVTDVKYGTLISDIAPKYPDDFKKENWAFAGWKDVAGDEVIGADATLGDGDATYQAQWSQTHAQYTVKHIREALDGTYTEAVDLYEAEYKLGEIGKDTAAEAKTYEGFTALRFEQTEVTAEGVTVTIYYERNKHKVTFKLDNGDADVEETDVKFGTPLKNILPAGFAKKNYEFKGWAPEIGPDATLGDADITYTAQWEKVYSDYTVKHIREGLDGTYDENNTELCEKESLNGKIGENTEVTAKTYEGFTAVIEQVVIPETDDLVITVKYVRNKHKVTFKLDNGDADVVKENVKYGTYINTIAPTGFEKDEYGFTGWDPEITPNTTLGDADVTYTAQWSQTHALYTVKHIREGLDGTYDENITELYEDEELNGQIGEKTEAQANTYEGFTALEFEQVDVLANGSAVVIIKYERNKHDVTFKLNGGVTADEKSEIVIPDVKYGTLISGIAPKYPDDFARAGWTFEGWNPVIDADATLGDDAETYTAQWKQLEAGITIKFIFEALDPADDPEIITVDQSGMVGNTVNILAMVKEGFTPDATFKDITVDEDAQNNIVEFYYTRNKHNVTFVLDNGEDDIVVTDVKYGTNILDIAPEYLTDFSKEDWSFTGWNPEIDSNTTLGDAPATYTAQWSQTHAQYTVKHIREDLDGNYDENNTELCYVESSKGEIGEKTEAQAKTYEGFTALSFEQVDILDDGSAVVIIKYERNKHDVTFVLDNGEEDIVVTGVKYGAFIEPLAPTDFTKEGSMFDKWDPEFDSTTTMPDEAVTYTALWIPEKVTVRFLSGMYNNPKVLEELELDYGAKVEKEVIDAQPISSIDRYGYVKKASYAPFYNNETHKTYSDYWYINDEGEWELFDENVVVNRDIDVYAWYNYLRVQLTVPQLTSLAPPLLVPYTPDQTRIMDTAKDLLYQANNVWIKNFVNEDKYRELRDKAFEKAAKAGVIDEYGQIKITEVPVKITSVIKPEEIHKEVKGYIRDIITNEDKLEQIFSMISPSDLISLIGVENLLGMLSDQQIADIINGMDSDNIIDLIIDYPDVKDIVVDALKGLITPDDEGRVADIELRNKVIAQIEHQLATDSTIREHILSDSNLLDWVLTSFESQIEDKAVTDNDFIRAILSEDSIRVSMIEKLLANDKFVDVLKSNPTLKQHLLDTIRGNIGQDIKDMLDPDTGNAEFKKEILGAIKNNSGLLASLNDSMSDEFLNAMGGFGSSADLKAYVLYAVKKHYGKSSDYNGTDYSSVISDSLINDKITEVENEIRASDLKDYVLHVVKEYYNIDSEYNGTDYSDLISEDEIKSVISEKEAEIRGSDLKDYVLHVVKEYYNIDSEYNGTDYSDLISEDEIKSVILEKEAEIRGSDLKDYVLHVVKEYYGTDSDYTGEGYQDVISEDEIISIITEKEEEIENSTLKDYVIHVAKDKYGMNSEYGGEEYSNLVSEDAIYGKLSELESKVRGENPGIPDEIVYESVLQLLDEEWENILPEFMADAVIAEVDNNFDGILDSYIADAVIAEVENNFVDILDSYIADAVIAEVENNFVDILDSYLADAVIAEVENNFVDILDSYIADAVIAEVEDNFDDILDSYLTDAVIKGIEDSWDTILDEYLADAVIKGIDDGWDTLFGDVSDENSIAYKVDEFKNGAIDAFVNNNGDLTGTEYAPVQGMIDEGILSLISDFIDGRSFGEELEDKIAGVMMDFALQDVDEIENQEIKELLTEAQDAFKEKAKSLDTDTIVEAFISYRDENDDNKNVVKTAVAENYEDIIAYVESSLFDDEGNLATDGDIYNTIDVLLRDNAEAISYDDFAGLLDKLLENDSDIVAEYFSDFVENPDNRDIVAEQVENYIAQGNINAEFIASHRTQIENALTNEGIDLSTYVTADVIKNYVNNLGGEEEKIAFADKVYESLEEVEMYKEFMSSFDNELDTFPIHKDNTLFVMGIAEAIQSFDYDTIMVLVKERLPDNNYVDKALDLFGDQFLREMYTEAQTNYYQGIVDIVDEIEADKAAGVEPKTYEYPTSITFRANLVEMLRSAYDRGSAKAFALLDEKGIDYTSNQYLNYLLTNDYIDEILYYTGMEEVDDEFAGYDIRSEEEYAEMVVKYAILLDDAICWYGDNLSDEKIQTIITAVLNKTFGLHDKLNEILTEYSATGDLPAQAENVINGVQQINSLFTRYQSQIDTVVDRYLASALNKHFEASDVPGKDKVQTGLDIMLGTDDPTFTIDYLYELFYRYDDKAQSKLKQLIDSGKLEKAVKKFEETELVQILGRFTDNSRVTSLAEKADEIKNSGRVKSSFASVYDLLVFISENGIEPLRVDKDVITVRDAYVVSIRGIELKIAREFGNVN